jgi:hypothetical protein
LAQGTLPVASSEFFKADLLGVSMVSGDSHSGALRLW